MPTTIRTSQLVGETAGTLGTSRSGVSQLVVEAASQTDADGRVSSLMIETVAHTASDSRVSQVLVEVLYKVTPPTPPELFGTGGIVFAGPGIATETSIPTDCIVVAVDVAVGAPCPPSDCVTICLSVEQEFFG